MNLEDALAQLNEHQDPAKAESSAAYHKAPRPYLGVANPIINDLTKEWRTQMDVEQRVDLADALWETDIFEARIAAAKLLTQARIREDDDVWGLIASWVDEFDSLAIADYACMAGQKRVVADPSRIDHIEAWVTSEHMWTRRAALMITLPWTKQNYPKEQDMAIRQRVLGWAATLVPDRAWFVQKAIAGWLLELSKHDPETVAAFLEEHGAAMKPFAAKEAAKLLQ